MYIMELGLYILRVGEYWLREERKRKAGTDRIEIYCLELSI